MQTALAVRLAGAAVPVAGIVLVAFHPVQIGVHPGTVGAVDVLRDVVCRLPLFAGGMPQGFEQRRGSLGRGRLGEAGAEGVDVRSEEHTSELQSLMRISYA